MAQMKRDGKREHRIAMEIIVNAYGPEEQALGWYCRLDDKITLPFRARCVDERRISPSRKGEEVVVKGMLSEDECMHEMFVEIEWQERRLGVPLAQLEPISVDEETEEAIADWHYWVGRGHQLC